MNPTLDLLQKLIALPSNTPHDAGCCDLFMQHLAPLGFQAEYLNKEGITNLWATLKKGEGSLLVLAGHTDVVPTGPLAQWDSDPFSPTIRDGVLYGRGAADMKSGLAAMITATERFVSTAQWQGTLAFLITSDEEGPAHFGTQYVCEVLKSRGIRPDYAIVGEASSNETLGDRIIVGRRGSLGCNLKVLGKQGHVAYPHKVDNPIHRLSKALAEMVDTVWDTGNAYFPPTSFQVSNLHSGTGAANVVAGEASCVFNFRFSSESKVESLKERVHAILDKHCTGDHARYEADWWLSGLPFLTQPAELVQAAEASIQTETGLTPERFTGGGTSDARFIAPMGTQVVEIGPINDSIHKINEHVNVADLEPLSRIYEGVLRRLLG